MHVRFYFLVVFLRRSIFAKRNNKTNISGIIGVHRDPKKHNTPHFTTSPRTSVTLQRHNNHTISNVAVTHTSARTRQVIALI